MTVILKSLSAVHTTATNEMRHAKLLFDKCILPKMFCKFSLKHIFYCSTVGDVRNNLLMEIEAKERLIKHRKAYQITDYEIEVLTDVLNQYKMMLEDLGQEG